MEVWKDIVGHEGIYQVSNKGRVKSVERKVKHVDGRVRRLKERILTNKTYRDNYPSVSLWKNNKGKEFNVHRLVAEHFLDKKSEDLIVNHKDGDKRNNDVNNLEWVTYSENTQHAIKTGLHPIQEDSVQAKLTNAEVAEIKGRLIEGEFPAEISKDYGVARQTINNIKMGMTWKRIERVEG